DLAAPFAAAALVVAALAAPADLAAGLAAGFFALFTAVFFAILEPPSGKAMVSTDFSASGLPTGSVATARRAFRWRRRDESRQCCSRRAPHESCVPRTVPRHG